MDGERVPLRVELLLADKKELDDADAESDFSGLLVGGALPLPTFRVGLASAAEAEAPTSETVACADGDCDIDGDDVSEVDTDGEPDADAEVHSDALIVELGVARPVAVSLPGAIVAVTEADDGGETECEGELDTV